MSSSPMLRGTGGAARPGGFSSFPFPSSGPGRRGSVVGGSHWDDPRFLPGRAGPARLGVCVTKGLPAGWGRAGVGSGEQAWLESVELPRLLRGSSVVVKAAPTGVLGDD